MSCPHSPLLHYSKGEVYLFLSVYLELEALHVQLRCCRTVLLFCLDIHFPSLYFNETSPLTSSFPLFSPHLSHPHR